MPSASNKKPVAVSATGHILPQQMFTTLRACLKNPIPECGRPRPQHCSTSNRVLFLLRLLHFHVAAPGDGRTPSESNSTPKQVFKQALKAVLLGLSLAIVSENCPAADWPMYRGAPDLTGVAEGSLPEKPALLWSFKTQAPIKSSAAIVGNRVFIGSNDRHLYALDFRTGKQLWAFTNSDAIESSPLVLGGIVFVGANDANLYALDASNGKQLWKFETGDKILGAPNWFISSLAPSDGERAGVRAGVRGTSITNILIGSYDFKLYCLDAATGRSNWMYETGNYINGSPAVGDGVATFGGCDGVLYSVTLTNGSLAFSNEIGAPIAASVALAGGRAHFGHYENKFLCVDLKAGSNAWTFSDRQFPYFSSPAVTKDRVLFGGRDKKLHCVNRADGKPIWSFATRGKVDSSPVVCGDKVVVGSDDGRLYLVSLADGKELWSHEIGQAIESSPAVADGKIVIGCDDGTVYCFGMKGN